MFNLHAALALHPHPLGRRVNEQEFILQVNGVAISYGKGLQGLQLVLERSVQHQCVTLWA